MALYIALLEIDADVVAKLNQKHHVTEDEVRALIQYPAVVRAAFDDDPEYGPRWLATAWVDGEPFFAVLDPLPEWEGADAEVWRLRTAYWVRDP